MRIDQDGIQIVPRLEADVPACADFIPASGRATFGLPELDAVLGGGLPLHSSTLLAGSTGVGKTLTALLFAAAGARQGEQASVHDRGIGIHPHDLQHIFERFHRGKQGGRGHGLGLLHRRSPRAPPWWRDPRRVEGRFRLDVHAKTTAGGVR